MDTTQDSMDMDAFPTLDSNQENVGLVKKRGRPAKTSAKTTAKTIAKRKTGRRVSGDSIQSKKPASKGKVSGKRVPLKEQTNVQHKEDAEEVNEIAGQGNQDMTMDELIETKQPAKRKVPEKKTGKKSKKKQVEQTKDVEEQPAQRPKTTEVNGEFEFTPAVARQTKRTGRPAAQKPKANVNPTSSEPHQPEKIIPETQVAMEVDQSESREDNEEDDEALPQSVFRRTNNAREKIHSRQPLASRRRADSASDTERGGSDPALRRKLGEMTTKFEKLEVKFRNLREIGIIEANANFEKYKTQVQANAKAANDLINSLKKELEMYKALSKDSASLENEIITRDADLTRTQALADQLSTSLSEAQNENKALQAKLANSRSASAAADSVVGTKTPGSALRGKTPAQRTIMVGSAEAAQAAQVAQLKEDLYSDLTGLILRGVERKDESDVYDCIQTGRNGTLHFKLAIAKDTSTSTSTAYEDTEFQYTPRLDSNRDRDLIALLPEYLTDEITFARTNAAMFYGRVIETLMRKRAAGVEEE